MLGNSFKLNKYFTFKIPQLSKTVDDDNNVKPKVVY